MVAIIDPAEGGAYSSMDKCRILKYVSKDAEKRVWNWEEDGILLLTSMPTEKEVLAMTTFPRDDKKCPSHGRAVNSVPWRRR